MGLSGDRDGDRATILEVSDLRTHFLTERGRLRAVDGVSFTLGRGQTLGVVGESGSGKTVLSRSIMGMLPRRNCETTGSVVFEGRELTALPPRELSQLWCSEISMVFQDPMTALNPVVRIGRQVTEALRHNLGQSRQQAKKTAIGILESVGIPDPRRRFREYPHQLSGGMRQRVMIGTALSCNPSLVLADEPTTALDVTVQAQILHLLGSKLADRSMSMILVTHDLAVVAGHTDVVAVMYAGRIVEQAPTATLFTEMRMPYTEALLAAVPNVDSRRRGQFAGIPGRPPDLVDLPPGCAFAFRCQYARQRCHDEAPPLVEADAPGHRYACWYPVDPPARRGTSATAGLPSVPGRGSS